MEKLNFKAYAAEFLGTMTLVLFGCGTACAVGCDVEGGYLITALAFGLVLTGLAYAFGGVSGCHVNPAVTLAVYINKGISIWDAVFYWISQILGGIVGGAILKGFIADDKSALGSNLCIKATTYDAATLTKITTYSYFKSIILEVFLTAVFVLVILAITSSKKESNLAGIVIGATLTLVHILGIAYTGTSVNPARSLGVAIFAADKVYLQQVWVFIVAPLAGAAIAALIWKYLRPVDGSTPVKTKKK